MDCVRRFSQEGEFTGELSTPRFFCIHLGVQQWGLQPNRWRAAHFRWACIFSVRTGRSSIFQGLSSSEISFLAFSLPPYSKLRMKKKYEFYFPDNLFSLALVISSGSRFTFWKNTVMYKCAYPTQPTSHRYCIITSGNIKLCLYWQPDWHL